MKKIKRFPRKLKKEGKKFEFLYYDECLVIKMPDNVRVTKRMRYIDKYIAPCFAALYYDEEDVKDNSLYHPSKKCMEIYDNFDKFIRK